MQYNGRQKIDLGWGRNKRHKGFLVRWMEWINSTWPHPSHRLTNLGRGGNALQTLAPCMFGNMPRVDLAILEIGSLAKFLELKSIELVVRRFLSLPKPPSILFVTVPLWHKPEFEPEDEATLKACQWRFSQNDFHMSNLEHEMIKVVRDGHRA